MLTCAQEATARRIAHGARTGGLRQAAHLMISLTGGRLAYLFFLACSRFSLRALESSSCMAAKRRVWSEAIKWTKELRNLRTCTTHVGPRKRTSSQSEIPVDTH